MDPAPLPGIRVQGLTLSLIYMRRGPGGGMDPAPPGAMPSMASTMRAPVSGVCPVPESGFKVSSAPSAYLRRGAGGGMDPAPPGAMPSMASTLRAPVSGVCPPPSTGVSATGSASAVAYPDRASLDCPGRTCPTAGVRSGVGGRRSSCDGQVGALHVTLKTRWRMLVPDSLPAP